MASLAQWDTSHIEDYKSVYAADLTNLALYPTNPISWMRWFDEPYGNKQAEHKIRRPDQNIQVSKNESYPKAKHHEQLTITLDMPNLSDELIVKEEQAAAEAIGVVGTVDDLNQNFIDGIVNFILNGSDINPFARGMLEAAAEASGSTTINDPGHSDISSAISTAGKWDVYDDMVTDLAELDQNLENNGFVGQKGILAPPVAKPFIERYMVTNTSTPFSQVLGYPIFYHPQVDSGATTSAAMIYMFQMDKFVAHATPFQQKTFFSDEQEAWVWRWKMRAVEMSIPRWNGTDWVKAILGFDVDFTT